MRCVTARRSGSGWAGCGLVRFGGLGVLRSVVVWHGVAWRSSLCGVWRDKARLGGLGLLRYVKARLGMVRSGGQLNGYIRRKKWLVFQRKNDRELLTNI